MSNKIEGVFKFDWKISYVEYIFDPTRDYEKTSPVVEAKTLKGTKWYLRVYRRESSLPGFFTCCLCRLNDDDKSENISVTYKLELIDMYGKILKSVVKENITFSKRSGSEVDSFLDSSFLEQYWQFTGIRSPTLNFRCHIIEANYEKQAMTVEISTVILTQWKISVPGPENWTKKLKVPFHECTHIDIIIQASDEGINIKIEKVDLLQPYKMNISILSDENRKVDCELPKKAVETGNLRLGLKKANLWTNHAFTYRIRSLWYVPLQLLMEILIQSLRMIPLQV